MLNLYKIDTKYNKYLTQFDKNVKFNNLNKERRPYTGILFKVNDFLYFAPLAHPITKHKFMKNGIDFEKIQNGKFGAINFNNMIPIKKKFIINLNINNEKDVNYKTILKQQLYYIKNNENRLINKAKNLYNLVLNGLSNNDLKSRCCNFKLLEEKCKLYIPVFYIYQDREQGKLVVFSEEKNEPRYNLYGTAIVPEEQIGIVRGLRQLSDKTTFALVDENDKIKSFYSTKTNAVYKTIDELNNALVEN